MRRLLGALLALFTVCVPSAAAHGFTSVGVIGRGVSEDFEQPVVRADVNARGIAAVVWITRRGVQLAVARGGGRFSRPVRVPGSSEATNPQVRVDSAGDVAVLLQYFDHTFIAAPYSREGNCCYPLRLVIRHPNGRFERPLSVSPKHHDVFAPYLDVTPDGATAIFWQEARKGLLVNFSRRLGHLGRTERVMKGATALGVSITSTGESLFFWQPRWLGRRGNRYQATLYERDLARSGRLGPTRTLVQGNLSFGPFGTDGFGDAVATWNDEGRGGHPGVVAVRSPGGSFRVTLLPNSHDLSLGDSAVSVTPNGTLLLAYSGGSHVWAAIGSAGGGIAPLDAVGGGSKRLYPFGVTGSVDARGQGVIVWGLGDGLVATTRSAVGSYSKPVRLTRYSTARAQASYVDDAGDGGAVWVDRRGRIFVARFWAG